MPRHEERSKLEEERIAYMRSLRELLSSEPQHRSALRRAVIDGSPEEIGEVLSAGADPNQIDDIVTGCSVLGTAIEHRRSAEVIAQLLDAGADPDLPDRSGQSALFRAVDAACFDAQDAGSEPDWSIVRLLLLSGADPRLATVSGSSPAACAAAYGWSLQSEPGGPR